MTPPPPALTAAQGAAAPPPGFALRERRLTPGEAARLCAAIRETPNILGYRPGELARYPACLVAEATAEAAGPDAAPLAGVCIPKRMAAGWSEVAVLYVFAGYRGRGLGGALFHRTLAGLRAGGGAVYAISREPSVLRWMEEAGMRFVPEWRLPLAVQFARMRHYQSAYRFREALRKSRVFRDQPPFRCAVIS